MLCVLLFTVEFKYSSSTTRIFSLVWRYYLLLIYFSIFMFDLNLIKLGKNFGININCYYLVFVFYRFSVSIPLFFVYDQVEIYKPLFQLKNWYFNRLYKKFILHLMIFLMIIIIMIIIISLYYFINISCYRECQII